MANEGYYAKVYRVASLAEDRIRVDVYRIDPSPEPRVPPPLELSLELPARHLELVRTVGDMIADAAARKLVWNAGLGVTLPGPSGIRIPAGITKLLKLTRAST